MAVKPPIIALVGRPNVGKSTLFNRIIGERKAVVDDTPGVTRDRNYALVERFSVPFFVVDTGGFERTSDEEIQTLITEQVVVACEEADVIVAVFDGSVGIQPGDRDIANLVRSFSRPVIYVVNKCDVAEHTIRITDFYELGIDEIFDVSALHGRKVRDFVETILTGLPNYQGLLASKTERDEREANAKEDSQEVFEQEAFAASFVDEPDEVDAQPRVAASPVFAPVFIPENEDYTQAEYDQRYKISQNIEPVYVSGDQEVIGNILRQHNIELDPEDTALPVPECIKVAIIGRPNVGKSTLLNKLIGEQRAMTSPLAGTTRDSIDVPLRRNGQDFLIIDTAGLRKKAKVYERIERYSVMRALSSMKESDVTVMVIDATTGPSDQDAKIIGLIDEVGAGLVIVLNKWGLVEKDNQTMQKFQDAVRDAFPFAAYAPILFVSAQSGQRCPQIIEEVRKVAGERYRRIATPVLNRVLRQCIAQHQLPFYRSRAVKFFYGAQIDDAPPRFALFFNYPEAVDVSYQRFIKNALRQVFGFAGNDIKLALRKR